MSSNLIQTLIPDLLDNGLMSRVELYEEATNFLDAVSSYTEELQICLDYINSHTHTDPITKKAEVMNSIEGLSNEFMMYWVDKYNTLPDFVKEKISSSIYNPFGEDVGFLGISEFVPDNSIVPYSPDKVKEVKTPSPYNYTSHKKLHPKTQLLSHIMSNMNNKLLRNNMKVIISNVDNKPTSAHSDNLITDTEHWNRITLISTDILSTLSSIFKSLYPIMVYYSNMNCQNTKHNKKKIQKSGMIIYNEGKPESTSFTGNIIRMEKKISDIQERLSSL